MWAFFTDVILPILTAIVLITAGFGQPDWRQSRWWPWSLVFAGMQEGA
jgi:hypothetical protein